MKFRIIKVGSDLDVKTLTKFEVTFTHEVEPYVKKYLNEHKFKGLWIDALPYGYLKTKIFNIGAIKDD